MAYHSKNKKGNAKVLKYILLIGLFTGLISDGYS